MTPQELKNSILQLAIQGKLVERRPEEGTAGELFAQVQAEKQRLIQEGKIKKEKSLPEITEDEKPFEIPESWMWVRLSQIWTVLNGDRGKNYPAKAKLSESGIPFISAGNLDGKTVVQDESLLCMTEEQYSKLGNGKLQKGDVVVCIRGSLGKHGVYPFDKGAIASSLVILRNSFEKETMDEFLMYYLDSPLLLSEIKRYDNGTAQPNLAAKSLEQFLFPLPSLAEQKRIVAKIEELMPYIDRYERAWTKLERFNSRFPDDMKKSLLQYAIQGKLVEQRPEEGTAQELFAQIQEEKQRLIQEGKIKKQKPLPPITDDEKPFEIPESWMWVRWGDLSRSIQYGYNAPAQESGRIKMVRISDIQDGKVLWDSVPYCEIEEDEISTYLLGANDILFARTGGTVGKSYLVKEVPEEAIYAGYLIRTRYSSLLYPEYLKYFMESQLYWEQLRNGTIATAQPNCNGKTLSKMILPLPPLAEQKRIVEKLEQLLPLCERL